MSITIKNPELCADCSEEDCRVRGEGLITDRTGCWSAPGRPGFNFVMSAQIRTVERTIAATKIQVASFKEGDLF